MVRGSVIAIIMVQLLAHGLPAYALQPTCDYPLKSVLSMIGVSPKRVRAIHYNSLIEEVIEHPTQEQLLLQFETVLERAEPLLPAFPKNDFLTWFRAHPFTEVELKRLVEERTSARKSPMTIGDFLNLRAKEFSDTLPAADLDQIVSAANHLRELAKSLKQKDLKAAFASSNELLKFSARKAFPCLTRNPKIILGTGIGYVIGNLGSVQGYLAQPKLKRMGYSYEGLINGSLWTPVLSEISCRIAQKGQSAQAGLLADQKAFGGEAIKDAARSGGLQIRPDPFPDSGMTKFGKLWLASTATAPFEDFSYTFFHINFEKKRQKRCREAGRTDCKEVDSSFKHLASNYGSLLIWDGFPAALRKMYIQQPLYYNFLPNTVQPAISARIQPPASTVAYVVVDAAARYTISSINTYAFLQYQKRFIDNGKAAQAILKGNKKP